VADYETLRQAHAASAWAAMPELAARMTWPVEQLRREREAKLRRVLAHAKTSSPWHRARLAAVDVDRFGEADLRALPVMTKQDMMDHFDAVVTDPRLTRNVVEAHLDALTTDAYLLDEYHVCASGGSSGRRGIFVYDRDGWATTFLSYLRFSILHMQQTLGAEVPRMAIVSADKASHMTGAMGQTFPPPGDPVPRFPATWPIARIVAGLNEHQPNVLMGYASMVLQLAKEAEAGRLRIAPKLINTTSEPLLPEMREAFAAVWGAPVFNGFGSTEGLMGGSCSAEQGMHLSDDLFVIELVDGAGRPVPTGTRASKVYLTSLTNLTQPLIRYELTDEMIRLPDPCSCGMTLMRIADVEGRVDDGFVYADGPTLHPFTFRSHLGRAREIVEYQVRQTADGADVHVVASAPLDTNALADRLRAALVGHGLARAAVTVRVVEALDRQATGKLRRFVPLLTATR